MRRAKGESLSYAFSYGLLTSLRLRVCVCVYIKLHITAQPGPDMLSFYATRIDPPYGGSVIATVMTSSDKTRQRGSVFFFLIASNRATRP